MQREKENAISQSGKSDLELPDSAEQIDKWYHQLFFEIKKNPPEFYVRAVNVFENEIQEITRIQYSYFEWAAKIRDTVINIFRI